MRCRTRRASAGSLRTSASWSISAWAYMMSAHSLQPLEFQDVLLIEVLVNVYSFIPRVQNEVEEESVK